MPLRRACALSCRFPDDPLDFSATSHPLTQGASPPLHTPRSGRPRPGRGSGLITLRNLTLRRGTKVVLDQASVVLNPGEKASLVGRNGAGKSSLFALLTHKLQADAGDFSIPPTWRWAEVAQSMPETDQPATEFVLDGDTRLLEARTQLEVAEAADDGLAMAEAHMALAEAGSFDARPRAQALLMGLGFKTAQLDAPVNSFSGGWRMRLQLARALMCPADLLLLDEPTNHLDLDALVWLESWLQRYEGTLLIISHDREFLDAITRVTLHLEDAKINRYGGNYTAFESMRAERMSQQASAFARQQDRMAHLQRFIDRFKAKASKAKQAQSRVKALERMEKLAPVLTASDFAFEFREPLSLPNPMLAMRDMVCGYMVPPADEVVGTPPAGAGEPALGRPGAGFVVPPAGEYAGTPPAGAGEPALGRPGAGFVVPPAGEYAGTPPAGAGEPALGRPGAGFVVPPAGEYAGTPPAGAGEPALGRPADQLIPHPIVSGVTRSILPGQRIGILGANGQGKSTLVKTLAQTLPALSGTVTEGKGLAVGYFAQQEMDVLRSDEGALAHMVRLAKTAGPAGREQELRDFLGGFRFSADMVHQAVGSLSGGEKARLVLAMLVWQRPNLLLLDEPTNHLDLDTREALSMALNEYEGSLLLVSHDRALLREVCDEFWLVAHGGVEDFDGDLDDYQRWLLDQSKAQAQALKAASAAPAPSPAAPRAAPAVPAAVAAKSTAAAPIPREGGRETRAAAAAERQRRAEQARPLKKERSQVEARIETLTADKQALEQALVEGRVAGTDMAAHGQRLKAVADALDTAEARWLTLEEALQALD